MKRTQIYLDQELLEKLHLESEMSHKTISEIIRETVSAHFDANSRLRTQKLESVFGIWKERRFDVDEYIRSLRKDRDRDHS